MKNRYMERMIEQHIQQGPGEHTIDVVNNVMSRIELYEAKKRRRIYIAETILAVITSLASSGSILLIEYVFKKYKFLIELYNHNILNFDFQSLQYIFQGFFVFISISTAFVLYSMYKSRKGEAVQQHKASSGTL